jgi:hypothetical protein
MHEGAPVAIGLERQLERRRNPGEDPIDVRAHFIFALSRDCPDGFGIEFDHDPLRSHPATNDSGRKLLRDALLHRMDRLQDLWANRDAGLNTTRKTGRGGQLG